MSWTGFSIAVGLAGLVIAIPWTALGVVPLAIYLYG